MSIILTPLPNCFLLFYDLTGSYGVSLILFGLVIRLILFPHLPQGAQGHALHERPGGKAEGITAKSTPGTG